MRPAGCAAAQQHAGPDVRAAPEQGERRRSTANAPAVSPAAKPTASPSGPARIASAPADSSSIDTPTSIASAPQRLRQDAEQRDVAFHVRRSARRGR